MRLLKVIMAMAAIFALTAIGACAVEVFFLARDMRAANSALAREFKDRKILEHMDAALIDVRRDIQIAGGVLNQTRDIERDNRVDLKAANTKTLATLAHVDDLIISLDASQRQAASAIAQTSAALLPVMQQTQQDLAELQPAIQRLPPLLQRSTEIAGNLSDATSDVQHEIHKMVYPPPRKWYQKYFLDPIKIGLHLVTIPLDHL
jgi:hypothetical protein